MTGSILTPVSKLLFEESLLCLLPTLACSTHPTTQSQSIRSQACWTSMLPHAVALSLYAFCHCPRVAVMELHQDLQCPSPVHSWLPSLLLLPALYTDNRSAWSTAQTIPLLSAEYSPNAQAARHPFSPIFYDTWLHTLCATETEQDLVGPSWVQKPFCVPSFLFVGLPWVPKARSKQLLIREVRECRNRGKAVKKNIEQQ